MSRASLVLASRSVARRDLLRAAGYRVRVVAADVDEARIGRRLSFERRLCRLAEAKAARVAGLFPDAYVLGADTALWLDDEWLGKPADADAALDLLSRLAGRCHQVGSGVCLIAPRTGPHRRRQVRCGVDTARVTIRAWPVDRLKDYIRRVRPFTCAGAYALQDRGRAAPIAAIQGDPSTVIGLPLPVVERLLKTLSTNNQGGLRPQPKCVGIDS